MFQITECVQWFDLPSSWLLSSHFIGALRTSTWNQERKENGKILHLFLFYYFEVYLSLKMIWIPLKLGNTFSAPIHFRDLFASISSRNLGRASTTKFGFVAQAREEQPDSTANTAMDDKRQRSNFNHVNFGPIFLSCYFFFLVVSGWRKYNRYFLQQAFWRKTKMNRWWTRTWILWS